MDFHKTWIEQCEAARGIEDELGTDKALKYLVEEKFIEFLEAAETNTDFWSEIPAFVAEIKTIFDPWQLRECLENARLTKLFDPSYDDDEEMDSEDIKLRRQEDICRCARDLLMVERASKWLLGESP
jgi:hypothetical protein